MIGHRGEVKGMDVVVRLNEIYVLGLGDDRSFIVRILPLVSGIVLRFFGDCLRNGRTWEQCKDDLLREFFSPFRLSEDDA